MYIHDLSALWLPLHGYDISANSDNWDCVVHLKGYCGSKFTMDSCKIIYDLFLHMVNDTDCSYLVWNSCQMLFTTT